MSYVALTRIKVDKTQYIEPGEAVSEGDVDDLDQLVECGAVVTEEEYDRIFPEAEEGENQAYGMPSNLEQITGTELAAPELDEEEPSEDDKKPVKKAAAPKKDDDS